MDTLKVLVCITPQSNSRRLIDKGSEIARGLGGELHILHVIKGHSIFHTDDSTRLLQQLFTYASELGGIVHGQTGEDVVAVIKRFIKKEKITHVLLGEPPVEFADDPNDIIHQLRTSMAYLRFEVLPREVDN